MGAFAEFEHGFIKERQMEGIAKAKERGVYNHYRSLSEEQVNEIKNILAKETKLNRINKTELAQRYGICKSTLYNYIKNYINY